MIEKFDAFSVTLKLNFLRRVIAKLHSVYILIKKEENKLA
jgi:hypothetical protein